MNRLLWFAAGCAAAYVLSGYLEGFFESPQPCPAQAAGPGQEDVCGEKTPSAQGADEL
jgi:hypothetical protein